MASKHDVFRAYENIGSLDEASSIAATNSDTRELVDQINGWHETGELGQELDDEVNRRASRLLYDVFLYVTDGLHFNTYRGIFRATVRMLAIIWVLMPDMLRCKKQRGEESGKLCTLEDMASSFSPRISRCWLSMVAEDASVCFGFFSRNQKKGSSRANYAAATKAAWERRRKVYDADKTRTQKTKVH